MNIPKSSVTGGEAHSDLDGGLVWPPADGSRGAPLVVDTQFGTVMSVGEAAATLNAGAEKQGLPYRASRAQKEGMAEPAMEPMKTPDAPVESANRRLPVRSLLILALSAIVLVQTIAIAMFTVQLRSEREQRAGQNAATAAGARDSRMAEANVQQVGSGRNAPEPTTGAAHASPPVSGESQLLVRTQPAGAVVYVDGKRQGASPVSLSGLAAGEHRVRIESGSASAEQTVALDPGSNVLLMTPSRSPSRSSGWLDVRAPADVQVLERGTPVGNSSDGPLMMTTGSHRLVLRNEKLGYSQEVQVTVPPGDIVRLRPSFPDGVLQVNAQPWASVWVDGQPVGDTPLGNVRVALGTHEVRFRHPDMGEQVRYVTVSAQAANRVSVDLRK